jgi:hypothetical protein
MRNIVGEGLRFLAGKLFMCAPSGRHVREVGVL